MKADRKTKGEKSPPDAKTAKRSRRVAPKTNGKHPLATYEHIPVGIVEASLDGNYVDANAEFCRILEYSKDELLQVGIKDYTHEDDYGIDIKLYKQLVAGRIPFYRLEKRYIRKSGGDIWVELTRTLVCDAQGKPLHTVGVVLDISDRKDVEKVLRESVERLRLATETARMFMWEWDFQNYSYILADNFEQVLGFSANLLPKNSFETLGRLIPAEDVQAIANGFEQAVQSRRDLHSLACRVIDPETGQLVWLEVNAKIVYDHQGNPVRMFGVAQNITEKKKAEADLQFARRQAEQSADRTSLLQKVTAALSEPLTPIQVAKVVVQQGAPAFGAVSSSMMLLSNDGQSLEIMYSTSPESSTRPYSRFPVSLRVPAADAARLGELVWIESRQQYLERYPQLAEQINRWGQQAAIAIPLTYQGRTLGVLTLSFDRALPHSIEEEEYFLTLARQGAQALERARAEDALRESEERFRALVSQATAGIAETDIESRLMFVNPRFCEMLGYSNEELLGKTIWEITYTDDLEENKRLFQRMLAKGTPYRFEKRFIRRDGSLLWTDVSVTTIHDSSGKPKGGVGVMIDIEERRQAEQALAEFARQQEALYKLSEQLHRTDSLEDVYAAALDAILSALQCDRASILLYDNTDVMRFVAWRGLSAGYRKATDGHSPWMPDTKDPQPISMDDVRAADLDESLRAVIQGEGIGALAFIPLLVNEKLIGKFMIYYNAPHIFDEAELDLSLTIAHQLAFGIERKRTEQALRIENERFLQFVNSNIVGILIGNASGDVILANDYYLNLLGVSRQELLERKVDWKRLTPPEWLAADEKAIQELRERGVCEPYEKEYIRTDGARVPVYIADAMLPGPGDEIVAFVLDITERKRVEQDLRESEERYRFIVENTSDGIWWIELTQPMPLTLPEDEQVEWYYNHAVIRQCNLGLARMYGYDSVEDIVGLPLREVMPRQNPMNLEMLRQFIRADYRLVDTETREVGKDGQELVFLNNMIGIVEDGKLKGEWGTNRDITERKRAEEALRESEERYRGIVNQTIAGIAETDLTGKYMMVNDRYCEITGYTRHELLSQEMRMQDITHPDDVQRNLDMFGQLIADGTSFEIEKRYVHPDGSTIWVHNSVSAITGANGQPRSAVAAVLDVTERKRAEEALRRNEELFSTLVEAAPFGVYFIDSEFRLRAINKGSEKVFSGIYPLIGRDFAEILRIVWQEPFATEAIEQFRHTLQTGEAFISPPTIEPRANIDEIQSYDWQIHRITMPDGTFGVVCYFYDLSEQKRMEARVRASESLYRAIARNIPGGGVYVVDKDFRYLVAEGPVTEAFGLRRDILEGRTVMEVFPDERGKRMEERLRRNFAGETVGFETNFNGRVYWTQQAPLHDSIGEAIILTLDITERKQVEDALRQSEERFSRFMQQLPGLAWIKDVEGRYVYANAAAERAFGTSLEKLYGKTDDDIFPPEFATQFRRNDEQALQDEKGIQVIETLRHEDGLHYSLVSKFPIPGADGNTALIGGTAFDITERRRAEEALRESEERFRAILRQATAGIVRKDANGRLIFVNDAFCNMLGYPESELLDKTMWDVIHPDDILENKRSYERLMKEGIPFKLERRFLRKDGSVIWVDASVSPIMDSQGKPQSAVAVEVDITGRKQAEEALRELNLQLEDRVLSRTAKLRAVNQTLREEIAERKRVETALRKSEAAARENEEKLSTLFELLPVGISFLDHDGQIIQMNSALTNILKLSREQFSEDTYRARTYIRANGTLMPPQEFASRRALAERKTIYNVETGIVIENSEVIWTSVSAAPVAVADVGAVVVTADITESKRAERALQESRERLQVLSQRLVEVQEDERRAIARELHDRVGQTLAALNINLIIISGQLGDKVDGQISTRLNDSMKLVAETISLVRDVMSNLRPSVLDDYGLESAIESYLSQYVARYEINAELKKPASPLPRLGPSIEMTFLRIAQEALMNIAKHAQASQVTLSLQCEENLVSLIVQDNGLGITSWQEANRAGSHGLTIMRERAEAFGGTLRLTSTPGKGTTVEVKIPVETNVPSHAKKEDTQ